MFFRVYVFIGALIMLSPGTAAAAYQYAPAEEIVTPQTDMGERSTALDQETDRFLKAKEYVFKREWRAAQHRLEDYLDDYPSGSYRDEALYWLAQSANRLANRNAFVEHVIALKGQAMSHLNRLLTNHPTSIWKDDAQTLRMSLAGQLYLLTGEEIPGVDEAEVMAPMEEAEMEVMTWDLLQDLETEVAIAVLNRILEQHENPLVRKNVIGYLALHYYDRADMVLEKIVRDDPDEAVREEAARVLERIEMDKIPVRLNYFCFSAKLDDKNELRQLPEGQLTLFSLPHGQPRNHKKAEKAIEGLFNKKLKDLNNVSSSFDAVNNRLSLQFSTYLNKAIDYNLYLDKYIAFAEGKTIRPKISDAIKDAMKEYRHFAVRYDLGAVSHKIYNFQVSALGEDFEKGYDRISGTVRFYDVENEKEYTQTYTVDDSADKLVAMRKGDEVALVLLQFESDEMDIKEKIIYHTKFNDVNGCTIHSSRSSWSGIEMAGVGGVTDFGESKAEIPGETGKWELVGNIISDGSNKRLIGRNAVLYDPSRKIVAEAAQIIVPVDHPEKFEVKGGK